MNGDPIPSVACDLFLSLQGGIGGKQFFHCNFAHIIISFRSREKPYFVDYNDREDIIVSLQENDAGTMIAYILAILPCRTYDHWQGISGCQFLLFGNWKKGIYYRPAWVGTNEAP